jgi:hypothetical protein
MRIRVAAAHCIALALTADPGSGFVQADEDNERVTRGGDYVFDVEPEKLRTFFRSGFSSAPESGHRHIGFRCARSAPAGAARGCAERRRR